MRTADLNRRGGSVVLADADHQERALAADAFRRAGFEIIEVETGTEALDASRDEGVGLVVLEVVLPEMTGYEVCRDLREERGDELAIFFLSGTRTESLDRVTGLLFGADDFIVKPFDPDELIARVSRFVSRRATAKPDGTLVGRLRLTTREREVLNLLAEGRGQKEIAHDLTISSKTVGTHIQNLLTKFGVHSRAELVASAYREGFVGAPFDRRVGDKAKQGGDVIMLAPLNGEQARSA
jgi:DNA-binding NarL/FixJ family response regulator